MKLKKLSEEEFNASPNGIQFIAVREKLNVEVSKEHYEMAMKDHPEYFE